MKCANKEDNAIWKKSFATILKRVFALYGLDYLEFAKQYHYSDSTVRYWLSGRSFPSAGINDLKDFFNANIVDTNVHNEQFYEEVHSIFADNEAEHIYYMLRKHYSTINTFSGEVLVTCRDIAKNGLSTVQSGCNAFPTTGRIQAIVFDFDGTLTSTKANRTTWEQLWMTLGYDVKECQELHLRFNRHEITHAEWCKLTEEKFCKRNLHREDVDKLATKIRLLKGVRATFQELQRRDIKIYIVSGSILSIIRSALGSNYQFIDGIKANQFRYNESGILTEIVGTKYDFEGKADFISEISTELKISPEDILFVGNSMNDRFAYLSGAQTLCINPKMTDITNRQIWNNCIQSCQDLREILEFIK